MCWELTDFCDVRRLADGRLNQSVCFLTWAPVSQVRTLRLCAIFLERRAAPPQEGWRPSLFNRSGLPQKLVQLSIKPMLFCEQHLDIQPLSDDYFSTYPEIRTTIRNYKPRSDSRNEVHFCKSWHSWCCSIWQRTSICKWWVCHFRRGVGLQACNLQSWIHTI